VNIISSLAYRGSDKGPLNLHVQVPHKLQTAPKLWDITTEMENIPAGETAVEYN
jgi:hypothetical protein